MVDEKSLLRRLLYTVYGVPRTPSEDDVMILRDTANLLEAEARAHRRAADLVEKHDTLAGAYEEVNDEDLEPVEPG